MDLNVRKRVTERILSGTGEVWGLELENVEKAGMNTLWGRNEVAK